MCSCEQSSNKNYKNPLIQSRVDMNLRDNVITLQEYWHRDSADDTYKTKEHKTWLFNSSGMLVKKDEWQPWGNMGKLGSNSEYFYDAQGKLLHFNYGLLVGTQTNHSQLTLVYKTNEDVIVKDKTDSIVIATINVVKTDTGILVYYNQLSHMERQNTYSYNNNGRLNWLNEQLYIIDKNKVKRWEDSTFTIFHYNPTNTLIKKEIYWADVSQQDNGHYFNTLTYNKQGDVTREQFKTSYNLFTYVYDAHGNWVKCSEIKMAKNLFDGEIEQSDYIVQERIITYK